MKFLFDLLPVIFFFAGYVSGHTIPALGLTKPILFATLLAMLVSVTQIVWLLVRGKKIDLLQWISFGLIVTMGGATVLLHNPIFIYIKPSALSCAMALALLVSRYGMRKPPLKAMLGKELTLTDAVWDKMMWAWVGFFLFDAAANLYVAFSFSEATWVKYKLVSMIALPLIFIVVQVLWLARHMPHEDAPTEES